MKKKWRKSRIASENCTPNIVESTMNIMNETYNVHS